MGLSHLCGEGAEGSVARVVVAAPGAEECRGGRQRAARQAGVLHEYIKHINRTRGRGR